ncbi:hypothetical protein AVEN_182005-1 [Araneus ventricosus]|uniref:Uncharacterized protein n=1 Tax=Araneus ventricosus TaxID=182803 RepID=A0A4Y2FDH4_ARAVE|nr:hypothetical protein AVEN_237366-1 [Araneus ventricosus]GBM37605.1 hypothetical protein AVEN_15604-1 [Araneus ventricosus]GBM37620.1 hypothetical protein AVEN_144297-1 [Araneus ventricosus]GBM37638.1 hypothetical protein AVEN_182005-1 [Araneus ventricosus]
MGTRWLQFCSEISFTADAADAKSGSNWFWLVWWSIIQLGVFRFMRETSGKLLHIVVKYFNGKVIWEHFGNMSRLILYETEDLRIDVEFYVEIINLFRHEGNSC